MRYSFRNGTAASRCWLRWSIILGFVACLNPRPEELPSERDPADVTATGNDGTNEESTNPRTDDDPSSPPSAPIGAGGTGGDMGLPNAGATPNGGGAGASGEGLDGGVGGDGAADAGGG